MRNASKGAVEGLVMIHQRIAAVEVERRTNPLGHAFDRNPFAVQFSIFIDKVMHGKPIRLEIEHRIVEILNFVPQIFIF
jgi:hypothetical protein